MIYVETLEQLAHHVEPFRPILESLDCQPIKVTGMMEERPAGRLMLVWWEREQAFTTKKFRLGREDAEFQGGRRIQTWEVKGGSEGNSHTLEYQCSTPKKNQSVCWSRSLLRLRGQRLWVVCYRPRRLRVTHHPESSPPQPYSLPGSPAWRPSDLSSAIHRTLPPLDSTSLGTSTPPSSSHWEYNPSVVEGPSSSWSSQPPTSTSLCAPSLFEGGTGVTMGGTHKSTHVGSLGDSFSSSTLPRRSMTEPSHPRHTPTSREPSSLLYPSPHSLGYSPSSSISSSSSSFSSHVSGDGSSDSLHRALPNLPLKQPPLTSSLYLNPSQRSPYPKAPTDLSPPFSKLRGKGETSSPPLPYPRLSGMGAPSAIPIPGFSENSANPPYANRRSAALSEVLAPMPCGVQPSHERGYPPVPLRGEHAPLTPLNGDQEYLCEVVHQMLQVAPNMQEEFLRRAEAEHTFTCGLGQQLRLLIAMTSQSLSYQRAHPRYSLETELILNIVACTHPSTFPRDAFSLFRHLQRRILGTTTGVRSESWNGCARWTASFVMEQMDGPPVYSYLNPEALDLFRRVPIHGTPEQIIGKTNIELYEEFYAKQFDQEDTVLLNDRYGLLVQASLAFPCAARRSYCSQCCIVHTKAHVMLREKCFIFACATIFQCQGLNNGNHSPLRVDSHLESRV